MTNDLIQTCMRGIVLETTGPEGDVPVDLVLPSTQRPETAVLYAGWWRQDWSPGFGLHLMPVALEGGVDGWVLADPVGATLTGVEADTHVDAASILRIERRLMDTRRLDYMLQLQYLQQFLSEGYDVEPWRKAVDARPTVDPVAEMLARNTAIRPVGVVVMSDGTQKVAAAAFDLLGNVAKVGESSWLAGILDDWKDRVRAGADEHDLEDNIGVLSATTQRGNLLVHKASVDRASGPIQEIARRGLN